MTEIEKAIEEVLDYIFFRGMKAKLSEKCVALVIKALERQKEEKCVERKAEKGVKYFQCPECKKSVWKCDLWNYCPDCGQCLDWSDEND